MKELKIGEVVEINYLDEDGDEELVKIEVVEDLGKKCEGCLFYCCELYLQYGNVQEKLVKCCEEKRKDKNNVVYKRVEG